MSETVPDRPRRSLFRAVFACVLLGAVLVLLAELLYILVGSNLRAVVPGRLYRCAQPSPSDLAHYRDRYQIRTVLALRGLCDFESWYRDEIQAAERLGLSMEVLGLSAGRLPGVPTIRRLCEILDHAEPPLLVHCQQGVDRTGLVSVLYLLLRTDATLDAARNQLSIRYLHINAGRTRAMGEFLDLYSDWLQSRGEDHRPERLRHWLMEVYRPPQGYADLELVEKGLDLASGDRMVRVSRDEPCVIPVRVRNDSRDDLHLSADLFGGLYLRWSLLKADRTPVLVSQPGGLRDARLPPGGSTELHVYLPPMKVPGRYWLMIDLFDRLVGSFAVYGSEPLLVELEVP